MKTMNPVTRVLIVAVSIALNVLGVFSLGGAFDIAAGLGYTDPLDPTLRGAAGVLGLSVLILAFRLWLRAFGIERLLTPMDD